MDGNLRVCASVAAATTALVTVTDVASSSRKGDWRRHAAALSRELSLSLSLSRGRPRQSDDAVRGGEAGRRDSSTEPDRGGVQKSAAGRRRPEARKTVRC